MKKIFRDIAIIIFILSLIGWDRSYVPENINSLQKEAIKNHNGEELPPREFKTDGCTLFPDYVFGYSWEDSCIKHDMSYWFGGGEDERLKADMELRDGVNKVIPGLGNLVYLGVRLGGNNLLPLWGWGYHTEYEKPVSKLKGEAELVLDEVKKYVEEGQNLIINNRNEKTKI